MGWPSRQPVRFVRAGSAVCGEHEMRSGVHAVEFTIESGTYMAFGLVTAPETPPELGQWGGPAGPRDGARGVRGVRVRVLALAAAQLAPMQRGESCPALTVRLFPSSRRRQRIAGQDRLANRQRALAQRFHRPTIRPPRLGRLRGDGLPAARAATGPAFRPSCGITAGCCIRCSTTTCLGWP